MHRSIQLFLALLAVAPGHAVCAQGTAPPRTIKVTARTNLGNLPYRHYFKDQEMLDSFLPRQPRMVDFQWRISFIELSEPEQDAYQPRSWAVALVDDGFEQILDAGRAGAGQVIEFRGPLQVVTLVETGDYLQAGAATPAAPDEE